MYTKFCLWEVQEQFNLVVIRVSSDGLMEEHLARADHAPPPDIRLYFGSLQRLEPFAVCEPSLLLIACLNFSDQLLTVAR